MCNGDKKLIGSGYIQEHQWTQLTKISDSQEADINLTGLSVNAFSTQTV